MKVISGIYKGRNILGHDIDGTRPTMDRVKESLFATIQNYIEDSIVLDLFSGSGNLAIESLSEGSKYAYAIDNNRKAITTIEKNKTTIGIDNLKSINLDYKKALSYFKDENIKFDIIFLDPPYKTNYIEESIKLITEYNLLNESGIIVAESSDIDKIIYPDNLEVVKSKKYGDKWVVILK
ncbi:MAG: 16S rRNA (guanine(966)-N(2))-methyltransferase RsmD [Firmicutes bacterium]|nr:16S rRNA (guanine(966)-N(2))-methyltransferase RsmD [Bacillota bacterium]